MNHFVDIKHITKHYSKSVAPIFNLVNPLEIAIHQLFWWLSFIYLILNYMSLISINKRPLIALLLAFSFLASGAFIISLGLVNTGGLFFYTPIVILAYLPIYWVLESKYEPQTINSWKKKEVWFLCVWMLFLHLVGIIETVVYERTLGLLFGAAFIALFLFMRRYLLFKKTKQRVFDNFPSQKIIFSWFAIIIACTLITLFFYAIRTEMTQEGQLVLLKNDQDVIEALISILFFVFLFFMLSWLFWQFSSMVRLRNEKKKTELLHLQSQVNPHFFFNTLNNLYGLVAEDAEKAQALILKLSDMMRYSIYEGQQNYVSITDEIAYLKNYVALHTMRYHKAIDIQFTTDIESEQQKVMPLLFILLLENAFKHGVENLSTDAYVRIHMESFQNKIHFSVVNNYDKNQVPKIMGIGLKNLKRRLELVYPNKHDLSFDISENLYKATLILKTV